MGKFKVSFTAVTSTVYSCDVNGVENAEDAVSVMEHWKDWVPNVGEAEMMSDWKLEHHVCVNDILDVRAEKAVVMCRICGSKIPAEQARNFCPDCGCRL